MSDYTATIGCVDLKVDWAETQNEGVAVQFGDGGLTESKIFMNYGEKTHHNALELLGAWMESHHFAGPEALVNELFAPGSEEKFTILAITRPQKPGDSGFVDFDAGFNVIDSWCVLTNRGTLPARRIQLIMRVSIVPTN